jgi:hypothetical protein
MAQNIIHHYFSSYWSMSHQSVLYQPINNRIPGIFSVGPQHQQARCQKRAFPTRTSTPTTLPPVVTHLSCLIFYCAYI